MINFSAVAKEIGVTTRTMWNWKAKGMPCERIGNVWKVKSVVQVKEWLLTQQKETK